MGGVFNSMLSISKGSNIFKDEAVLNSVTELSHVIVSFLQSSIMPISRRTSKPKIKSYGHFIPFGTTCRLVLIFIFFCNSGVWMKLVHVE